MNDFYVSYLWNLSNPGCYLGHHRGTEDTEVGITGAAIVRRDGARLWELAATHIVPFLQVRCTMLWLCAASYCYPGSQSHSLLTA